MIGDLRTQLKAVEEWGEVLHIRKEVDTRFELAAVCKKLEADKAVLFEKVKGYSMPVVVGLDNSHSRISRVLGTDDFGLTGRYLEAIRNPLPTMEVSDGPAKDVKITSHIDLLKLLPVGRITRRTAGLTLPQELSLLRTARARCAIFLTTACR